MLLSKNFDDFEFFIHQEDEFHTMLAGGINPGWYISSILVEKLQQLRDHFNESIKINSGYRTVAHNFSVKGKKYSTHLYGIAVDIQLTAQKVPVYYPIVKKIGFKGIGKGKDWLHLDVRNSKDLIEWSY